MSFSCDEPKKRSLTNSPFALDAKYAGSTP
jgi:hypothetical protein